MISVVERQLVLNKAVARKLGISFPTALPAQAGGRSRRSPAHEPVAVPFSMKTATAERPVASTFSRLTSEQPVIRQEPGGPAYFHLFMRPEEPELGHDTWAAGLESLGTKENKKV